jgi:hypothetical protein
VQRMVGQVIIRSSRGSRFARRSGAASLRWYNTHSLESVRELRQCRLSELTRKTFAHNEFFAVCPPDIRSAFAGLNLGAPLTKADILQGDGLPPFLRAQALDLHSCDPFMGRSRQDP